MNSENEGCLLGLGIWCGGFIAFYFDFLDWVIIVIGIFFIGALIKNSPLPMLAFFISVLVSAKVPALEFLFKPIAMIALLIAFLPVFFALFGGKDGGGGSSGDEE